MTTAAANAAVDDPLRGPDDPEVAAGLARYRTETLVAFALIAAAIAGWLLLGWRLMMDDNRGLTIGPAGRTVAYLAAVAFTPLSVWLRRRLMRPRTLAPFLVYEPSEIGKPLSHACTWAVGLTQLNLVSALALKVAGWDYLDFIVLCFFAAMGLLLHWPRLPEWRAAIVAARMEALKVRAADPHLLRPTARH